MLLTVYPDRVNSTIKTKNEKIPRYFNTVSFDVKSLFTFVPLEYTIELIIKRIFWRPWNYDNIHKIWKEETLEFI